MTTNNYFRGDAVKKVWLNRYPADVPAEINPDRYQSLVELFEHATTRYADQPAFINMGEVMTYRKLEERSRAFAAYLQEGLGLQKGDRVALMMPNLLQYPVALFGILRAGMIVVNVNPLYTPRELEHQLNDRRGGDRHSLQLCPYPGKSGGENSGPACDPDAHGRPAFHRQRHAGELCGQVH